MTAQQRPKLVPELLCSSLSNSLDFYCGLIGFSIRYDRPEDDFAYLELDGVELMLEEAAEDGPGWWTAPARKPYGRGINFEIRVADVTALNSRLKVASWPFFRPLKEKWYRAGNIEVGNHQLLAQDPDGYLLRFKENLGERPR